MGVQPVALPSWSGSRRLGRPVGKGAKVRWRMRSTWFGGLLVWPLRTLVLFRLWYDLLDRRGTTTTAPAQGTPMQTSAPRTMRSRRTGTRHERCGVQHPTSRHDDHVLRVAVRARPDTGGAAVAGSLPGGFAALHLCLAAIPGPDPGGDRAQGIEPGRGSSDDA